MKLDRNSNKSGKGKYALVLLRKGEPIRTPLPDGNICFVVPEEAIDFGDLPSTDFFVIRLRDKYAAPALEAYAVAAYVDDPEYGLEVLKLAKRANDHPDKKRPD